MLFVAFSKEPGDKVGALRHELSRARYVCADKTELSAVYYDANATSLVAREPSPNMPPTPTGSVDLTLSDNALITLPQTLSADGGRYANSDESVIFWSKGRGALYTKAGENEMNCIEVAIDHGGLPLVYASTTIGVSLRYPIGYSVSETYRGESAAKGDEVRGIFLTVPASYGSSTNLAPNTSVRIEYRDLLSTDECRATLFLPNAQMTTVFDGDVSYSFASSTDAGAGNRYEESVYALPYTHPCIGLHYFVHYALMENYSPGSVRASDKVELLSDFDAIRRSLIVAQ
jgi:membrane-bound inhibitor of C-type lysozyme